ncbi:MAG: NAD(P)H-hydrate dehydratase [Anaerolineae bacterium]|nr:NAD(P)H-hydrate dehydratase [Anaerolineae bacterium]
MKLLAVTQMRAVEQEANRGGYSYAQMMEKAGTGLAEILRRRYESIDRRAVVGLVGSGNNGGDTLVALETLARNGWVTAAYLVKSRGEDDPLVSRLLKAGGSVVSSSDDPDRSQLLVILDSADIILDGVLGTGFQLPLKPELAEILSFAKGHIQHQIVVAVDCPSGVDCESGETAPETIPAHVTVCMGAVKKGLVRFPAFEWVGELETVDLGFSENFSAWQQLADLVVDRDFVSSILPARPRTAHKGTFGTAMIAAGSVNYTGAAYLAAKAAYRVGTGLVRLAVPGPLYAPLAGQLPEATWLILPHDQGVISDHAAGVLVENLEKVSALLLGPGWGLEDTTAGFLRQLLQYKDKKTERSAKTGIGFVSPEKEEPHGETVKLPPLVVDADGLKLLARIPDWYSQIPEYSILTPHPGEMSVLTGLTVKEIQSDREETARRYAKKWGHVVVLKGALTVVASPDGTLGVIPVATSALARAGTGDVLAGVVVGLRAQGVPAFEAALGGCWIHAQAGLVALASSGQEISVMAGDVLEGLSKVLQDLLS